MKKRLKKTFFTILCVLLAFIMVFITACSDETITNLTQGEDSGFNTEDNTDSGITNPSQDDSKTPNIVVPSNPNTNDNDKSTNSETNNPQPNPIDEYIFEDYDIDDAEAYIYNLVYSDLSTEYDTFTGYIALSAAEDDEVYGICYTDYADAYMSQEGKVYFSSGFISFSDESTIDDAKKKSGLEIHSLTDSDDVYSYVYTYSTEEIHKHCIIYNKYVKYDIVEGNLQYSEEDYTWGMSVDTSRGNIFNYDTGEYDYIVEKTDYVPVTGVSLLGESDYQQIIDEVNRILNVQDENLTYQDIESYVSQSKDALYSYLLGLQEETFMGIPTAQLVNIVKDLDPMQHLQIGVDENGNTTIHIIEVTKLATLWEKIATTIVCAYGVVAGVALNIVGDALTAIVGPAAKVAFGALGGAIIGASLEAFSQVVINNTPVSDLQWAQIGVAAAAGAISGAITGALGAWQTQGIAKLVIKETIDVLCDGIIGGSEFFVNSLIAGQSFEQACKNFGYGMIAGVVISGGVKIATATIKGGARLIKKATSETVENVGDTQVVRLSQGATENASITKGANQGTKKASNKISSNIYSDTVYSRDVFSIADGSLNQNASEKIKHFIKNSEDFLYNADIVGHEQERHLLKSPVRNNLLARGMPDTAFYSGTYNSAKETLMNALDDSKIYFTSSKRFIDSVTRSKVDRYVFVIDNLTDIGFNKVTNGSCNKIRLVIDFVVDTNKISRVVSFYPV